MPCRTHAYKRGADRSRVDAALCHPLGLRARATPTPTRTPNLQETAHEHPHPAPPV